MSAHEARGEAALRIEQRLWTPEDSWSEPKGTPLGAEAQLVFAFGGRERLTIPFAFEELREFYPAARIVIASTAGEILDTRVYDDSLSVTAIRFESTRVEARSTNIADGRDITLAAADLMRSLPAAGMTHALVITDGLMVNGTHLARALREHAPPGVEVTGGLAGDGNRMVETVVGLDQAPRKGELVLIGLYGERLRVGHGSLGGWDPFGPFRLITRSEGRILHTLDDESALELYKTYLMEEAEQLPWSALLYPLELYVEGAPACLVRTVVGIDEQTQSLVFAGDIPEGHRARMMKANFDRLVNGAIGAAQHAKSMMEPEHAELALMVSCVGRKLILRQRTEEELEGVREALGERARLTGFYSYGEICPQHDSRGCVLHNQTMTITTFAEV